MTREEADLIIVEQNKSREEILKAVIKVKSDCQELCILKDKRIEELEKENAELKEKFLKVKSDDVRKSKLNSFKTLEEKNEYLRQVANYAIFNEDISVMFWCFTQRGDIYKDQYTKAEDLLKWFVWYFREGSSNLVPYKHKVKEAEQFLNSEVEK